MTATVHSKQHALNALYARRAANTGRKHIDNGSLPAGSPMYFYCIGCGDVLVVPESYITKPDCCYECEAMRKLGWLE